MPMDKRTESAEKLEQTLSRALRDLPLRRAPASLEMRVANELARRAALPWWRASFANWPAAARIAFVLLCAGLVAVTILGGVSAYLDGRSVNEASGAAALVEPAVPGGHVIGRRLGGTPGARDSAAVVVRRPGAGDLPLRDVIRVGCGGLSDALSPAPHWQVMIYEHFNFTALGFSVRAALCNGGGHAPRHRRRQNRAGRRLREHARARNGPFERFGIGSVGGRERRLQR